MKEYELPKTWYIQLTEENYDIVKEWHQNLRVHHRSYNINAYYGIHNNRPDAWAENYLPKEATLITTDQFIQYVLKQDAFPKNWAIRQNACQEACDWLNDNYPKYVKANGEAYLRGANAYITFEGKYIINAKDLGKHIEITKEQFIKHVLKEKHNYSKLINILKFIDESSRM